MPRSRWKASMSFDCGGPDGWSEQPERSGRWQLGVRETPKVVLCIFDSDAEVRILHPPPADPSLWDVLTSRAAEILCSASARARGGHEQVALAFGQRREGVPRHGAPRIFSIFFIWSSIHIIAAATFCLPANSTAIPAAFLELGRDLFTVPVMAGELDQLLPRCDRSFQATEGLCLRRRAAKEQLREDSQDRAACDGCKADLGLRALVLEQPFWAILDVARAP